MKKIILVFSSLCLILACVWVAKAKTPIARPDSYAGGNTSDTGIWWNTSDITEAEKEWVLDPEIPENYIPVPGENELYMVVDKDGNVVQYRHREKQEDGSWAWTDASEEIPEGYEAVPGLRNVYQTVDENGKTSYYKYVRNEDNSFAFVPVDRNGKPLDSQTPTGSSIPSNFVRVKGNIYAVLNEHGVIIGYKERYVNSKGEYAWKDAEKPKSSSKGSGSGISYNGGGNNSNPTAPPKGGNNSGGVNVVNPNGNNISKQPNGDGTYTETESFITTESAGGWVTTYRTTITRVYNAQGKLLSTKKDGPTPIDKKKVSGGDSAPNEASIAKTLSAETARISTGIPFKNDLANSILTEINTGRTTHGLAPLSMNNGDAAMIAKSRASAMAKYDYSDFDSPLYGTLDQMLKRFNISHSVTPTEITLKTTSSKSAADIYNRMIVTDAKNSFIDAKYSSAGISVSQKNGWIYVCVVLW